MLWIYPVIALLYKERKRISSETDAMNGLVVDINHHRGMVAIRTPQGFSIFELMGEDPVELGDEIAWKDDTALGGNMIHNRTQYESYEVYFQNHHVSRATLRRQMLY
ncbi:MAG: hypothetical protein RJS97_08385 [Parvibaculaceae bacterium]